MSNEEVYKFLKDSGCCEVCCLRYLGIKNPSAYEDVEDYLTKVTSSKLIYSNKMFII